MGSAFRIIASIAQRFGESSGPEGMVLRWVGFSGRIEMELKGGWRDEFGDGTAVLGGSMVAAAGDLFWLALRHGPGDVPPDELSIQKSAASRTAAALACSRHPTKQV
jgi:hypothetical protein